MPRDSARRPVGGSVLLRPGGTGYRGIGMAKIVTTNLRFPERLWRELRLQAVRRRTTAAELVREAVEVYLGRKAGAASTVPEADAFDRHVGAVGGPAPGSKSPRRKEVRRAAPRRPIRPD